MFGFYDPASLTFGLKGAVINFINAQDASDVTEVKIETAQDALMVAGALETQKVRGITTHDGKIIDFRGSIAFNPKAPDEAMITLEDSDSFGQAVPVKLGFSLGKATMPRFGYAMGQAAMRDGAMIVYKLAVRGLSNSFDRAPAPASVGHLN